MPIKDHYKTLEIHPQASLLEIKKAYRILARKFHPDKNENEQRATQLFQEVQAAYEILSNPIKRRSYDQELKRKAQYSYGQVRTIHPEELVKTAKDLYRYIRSTAIGTVNSDALADYVLSILHPDHIALLLRANDPKTNEEITHYILQSCTSIVSSRLFTQIATQLLLLHSSEDATAHINIRKELDLRLIQERQNKMVPLVAFVIIAIVILLMCLIL
jgi:molecular chaperone DnaJ